MKLNALLNKLVILLFLIAGGCSSGGDDGGSGGSSGGSGGSGGVTGGTGGNGGAGEPAPYPSLVWDFKEVDVDDPTHPAGVQGKLLRAADGTLYYGYYKYVAPDDTCDIAVFGGGTAPNISYELRLTVLGPAATDWTTPEIAPLADVGGAALAHATSLFGLDGTIEAATDNPVFALAAGESGLFSCGSSDLVLARRTGVDAWTFEAPVTESGACCSLEDCNGDPACNNGTDVGAWATIAESPGGALSVAYTDYHNFADQDGQTMQGYELWEESGAVTGLRPWDGLGVYSDIVFAGDTAITAHAGYNSAGLWVLRQEGSAGAPTDWIEVLAVPGVGVGERISLAVTEDGTVGLAYHEVSDSFGTNVHDLRYCESTDDGATWSTCDNVGDQVRQVGYYPSLAYDNENRPLIAYRFCGVDSCENAYDGLRLAWREHSGEWNTTTVHDEATSKSGLYNSLVMDPVTNEPTIAFHNHTRGAAYIARGDFF